MAEIQENIANQNENENSEELSISEGEATDEDEQIENQSTVKTSIIHQVKDLTATFEKLVLQLKPQDLDDGKVVSQKDIGSFYDLYRLWQEQVANLTTIQNMQAEDFQKQITEKDQVRQKLLMDLKNQEETHIIEMAKLKQQSMIELEAKDKICLELEEQIERQRGEYELGISCPICLDPWTLTGHHRLVSLACGHLFGDPCLRDCMSRQQVCPQCRAHASVHDIRYLYGRPL